MLAALAEELRPLAQELEPLGQALSAGDEEAAAQYLGLLERLANVGELLELPALGELTLHMLANVPAQLGDSGQRDLAAGWPGRLAEALGHPDQEENRNALLACLTDPRWPEPMETERARDLIQQILQCDADLTIEQRQPQTFDESELSLDIVSDLTPEMHAAFAHEAPRQAASLNHHLAELPRSDDIVETLNLARRVAHTLKGSAALVGARAVVNLTHLLEEVLGQLQEQPERLNYELRSDLQEAGDNLEEMIEHVLGEGERPAGIASILHRIDLWAVDLSQAADPATREAAAGHDSDAEPPISAEQIVAQIAADNASGGTPKDTATEADPATPSQPLTQPRAAAPAPAEAGAAAAQSETVEASLNVPVRVVDDMLRSVGELMIQVGHLQSQLRGNIERSGQLSQQLLTMQEAVHELESHVDLHGTPALQAVANASQELFDPLEMDQYNLLHSMSRSFAESALDAREMARELHDALLGMQNQLLQQQRLGREVNNAVLAARMVRVSSMVSRWQRIVRQACRVTGKDVNLDITGGDVLIDTDILNGLVEPLLHMLRNAVDHGIENGAQRLAQGKPEHGLIHLGFRQDGSRIEVTLTDDGRGLDFIAIEQRARALGLVKAGQDVTQTELQQWILLPGFTTREEVSEVSGRGIGLDAVRAAVQRLGGTMSLSSKTGEGLAVRLVLPQSLSSSHLLFVKVGDYQYGLPSLGIQQVLFSDTGEVENIGGRWTFRFANRESPLYRLADLIGMHGEADLSDLEQPRPLILVDRGDEHIALLVDAVIESRESVVKTLKTHFPNIHGASGASILADGGLAIVLDVAELNPEHEQSAPKLIPQLPQGREQRMDLPRIMVVDDSLSARRSLSRLMQDLGYRVDTALDGIEAVEQIEDARPDLVLADLEMPRMNGMELTAHLRSRDEYKDMPVIMITSRSTEKHRQQAERAGVNSYLTKPYQEQELIDLVRSHLLSARQRGA